MSTEAERRVRAAVRAALDELPVAQPSAAAIRYRADGLRQARRTAWMAPVLAAATVLAVVTAIGLVPGWLAPVVPPTPGGVLPMVLPPTIEQPHWRTASVVDAPLGAAVAAYRYGDRLVLVGGDGRSYRTVTAGELAAWGAGPVRPIREARLSPDGTRLAGAGGLIFDLVSGEARQVDVPPSVDRPRWQGLSHHRVLAWSPDGDRLAYRLASPEIGRIVDDWETGEGVAIVNLRTGVTRYLATGLTNLSVAFSPDGDTVAVTGTLAGYHLECVLQFYDAGGALLSQRNLTSGFSLAGEGTSWSPDGRWLAVQRNSGEYRLGLIPVTRDADTRVLSVTYSPRELLGWRTSSSLLVTGEDESGRLRIAELSADGEPSRYLSLLPEGATAGSGAVQLASGVLAGLEARQPAGEPDHGPPPTSWRVGFWAGVGVLLALVVGYGLWSVRRYGVRDRRQRAVE